MDISEFYDSNPARRESDEEGFGDGWSTEADQHSTYRANWLAATGELYVVREPHSTWRPNYAVQTRRTAHPPRWQTVGVGRIQNSV